MSKSILIVEDETTLARNIARYLQRKGYDTQCVATATLARSEVERLSPDILLIDYRLPDDNGIDVIRDARRNHPHLKVIMMTGAGNIEVAVDAMRAGANDYLSKPIVLAELSLRIDRLCADSDLRSTLNYYQEKAAQNSGLNAICGNSPEILSVKKQVSQLLEAENRLAEGAMPAVLIRGETGTGKELIARALHFDGTRHQQPFVDINCASIPEQLLESELFGHERGSFTDAKQTKNGLFEAANKGTLFLDEIGDMHIALQAKLLRVLEDGKVRRVGAIRDRVVDTRIIAATNQNLETEIESGKFRADLLYRLGVITIQLPALRDRKTDITLLAEQFLAQFSQRYGRQTMTLSEGAKFELTGYDWPGNVRELKNVIERSVLTTTSDTINEENLSLPATVTKPVATAQISQNTSVTAQANDGDLDLTRAEIRFINQALKASNGNITRAAILLGLGRDALRYKIEKHGLRPAQRT